MTAHPIIPPYPTNSPPEEEIFYLFEWFLDHTPKEIKQAMSVYRWPIDGSNQWWRTADIPGGTTAVNARLLNIAQQHPVFGALNILSINIYDGIYVCCAPTDNPNNHHRFHVSVKEAPSNCGMRIISGGTATMDRGPIEQPYFFFEHSKKPLTDHTKLLFRFSARFVMWYLMVMKYQSGFVVTGSREESSHLYELVKATGGKIISQGCANRKTGHEEFVGVTMFYPNRSDLYLKKHQS